MTTKKRLILVTLPAALLLAACSGGGSGAGEEADQVDWGAEPTGTLQAWGFDNADDVGTSRLDYAVEQLPDLDIQIDATAFRSEEHTAELQSRGHLVCRRLLEKKKKIENSI